MDAFNKIMEVGNKYIVSGLICIIGLMLFISGFGSDPTTQEASQTALFKYGGLAMLLMGVMSLLYVMEKINKTLHNIALVGVLGFAGLFVYFNYASIADRIAMNDKYASYRATTIQGMKDVRDIQVRFLDARQRYSKSWKELDDFVRNGTVRIAPQVTTDGYLKNLPTGGMSDDQAAMCGYLISDLNYDKKKESWSPEEAAICGIMKWDSTDVPVMEKLFTGPEAAEKKRDYPFNVDSLGIVRNQGGRKLFLDCGVADASDPYAVFHLMDGEPFDPFNIGDTLKVGSMTKRATNGNWGEK
jgi:hypothetical protein